MLFFFQVDCCVLYFNRCCHRTKWITCFPLFFIALSCHRKMCEKSEPLGLLMWFFVWCKEMRLRWVERCIDRATDKKKGEKEWATKPKKLCKHGTMTTKTLYRRAYCDTSDVPSLSNSVDHITSSPPPQPLLPLKIYHHHHRVTPARRQASSATAASAAAAADTKALHQFTNPIRSHHRQPNIYLKCIYLSILPSHVFEGTPSRGLQTWLFSLLFI